MNCLSPIWKNSLPPSTSDQTKAWRVLSFWMLSQLILACTGSAFAANDPPAAAEGSPAAAGEFLPEADQLTFARTLEQATTDGNVAAMNALIDWNQIIDTATAGESNPTLDRTRAEFKKGFLNAQNGGQNSALCQRIVDAVKQGGRFKFLRLGTVGTEQFALFRLKVPNQGVNYHQYILKRSEDGLVRATDLYLFLSAERTSETIRRIWLPLSADVSKTFFERLLKPTPLMAALSSLKPLQQYLREGQFDRFMEAYYKLPEQVQHEKFLLLMRLQATQQISDEEYAKTIEVFRKHHPHDPALDFLLIDGYALKKEFEKSLECIDRTNEATGGDAYLVSTRAVTLAQLGRFDEAKKSADKAIEMEPAEQDSYWNAITVAILAKNDEETGNYLTLIENELHLQIGDLTQIPFYADFVKSGGYAKWLESRK